MTLRLPSHWRSFTRRPYGRWVYVGLTGLTALACLWGADRLCPPDLTRFEQSSVAVVGADSGLLRLYPTPDQQFRRQATVAEIDQRYLTFLKTFEDKRFDLHPGVDPLALTRAIGQWLTAGEIVSGGSTLTMQVARLLEPRPRTIWSKFLECLRALQLEWHFSKVEILGLYASLAPFGGNIEGVATATQVYFGKAPNHMTIAEAALLTAIPQSPTQLRPDLHPQKARQARAKVLRRLRQAKIITPAEFHEAMEEPIPRQRIALPMDAPLLANALTRTYPGVNRIHTTILPALQRHVQTLAQSYAGRLPRDASVAVLVVDNSSQRVLAYVGSRQFTDRISHGYVDMIPAVRSPGSTLKPVLFALSFDQQQSHPQSLIWDRTPANAAYAPGNFDGREHGQVTIADSLQMSLNIPTIKLMERYGPIRFAETLRQHGFQMDLPGDSTAPNLAMALGGVGTSLQELVKLYRALGSDRKLCPLRTTVDIPLPNSCSVAPELIDKQAQTWLRGILEAAPRPANAATPIAFKTGTSYGYRDAWAIGYDHHFTVGVWTGKASGVPIPGQTGLGTAAPLLFSVFDALPYPQSYVPPAPQTDWLSPPPERLKIFERAQAQGQTSLSASTLDIQFPPDGSTFVLSDVQPRGIELKALNGQRPLAWLINGKPIPSQPWKRSTIWRPEFAGFYTITVLDQSGQHNSQQILIRNH